MGYNRSGVRRTARMKRAKQQDARLAKKAAEGAAAQEPEGHGLIAGVQQAAATVVHAVGAAVHTVTDALTGKKEAAPPPK